MQRGMHKKLERAELRNNLKLTGKTPFAVTEAYKMLRTNLIFTLNKVGCKKIIITSGLSKEGKSTTCVNLAIVLAQMNSKVLLIDCDLRKSTIHKMFKFKSVPGISDLLAGLCEQEDALRDTDMPNLRVICAGTVPPNPAELLGSDEMEACILRLEKDFDYILFDTPPINMVSDALSLSKLCDGVLVVVRQNQTVHSELSKTLSLLSYVEARVLGMVLNDSVPKKYTYQYRYNKRYRDYQYTYSDSGGFS